jgi:hypothetical protein
MVWLEDGKFCPVCGRFAIYPSVKRELLRKYHQEGNVTWQHISQMQANLAE